MAIVIANSENLILIKTSHGICIYREESLAATVAVKNEQRLWPAISLAGITVALIVVFFLPFGLDGNDYSFYPNAKAVSYDDSGVQQTAAASQTQTLLLGLPIRLKIPAIQLDAAIEPVGLTSQGALAVPVGATNAGWFNFGPRPGEGGTAVIDGHFGRWKNGTQTVFNNLNKLRKGDKIYVEDESGAVSSFVVSGTRKFEPDADASEVFESTDGKPRLNLITCGGTWNDAQKIYSYRLVVFADKEIIDQ